jgi:hypothetical protein
LRYLTYIEFIQHPMIASLFDEFAVRAINTSGSSWCSTDFLNPMAIIIDELVVVEGWKGKVEQLILPWIFTLAEYHGAGLMLVRIPVSDEEKTELFREVSPILSYNARRLTMIAGWISPGGEFQPLRHGERPCASLALGSCRWGLRLQNSAYRNAPLHSEA